MFPGLLALSGGPSLPPRLADPHDPLHAADGGRGGGSQAQPEAEGHQQDAALVSVLLEVKNIKRTEHWWADTMTTT